MQLGRRGLSPVMVGRRAHLQRLRELTERGESAVVLVVGEAGVGKTRLTQELLGATPRRYVVGQSDLSAFGRSFDAILDLLDRLDATADAATGQVPDRLGALRSELAQLDPELPAQAARRRIDGLVERAADLIVSLVGDGGIVVFEDLHWMDAESCAVFERIGHASGVVLVGTARPDSLTHRAPAAEMLLRLERRRDVEHVTLDRLSETELAQLVTAVSGVRPARPVVEALHARTGGNPYVVEELLRAVGDDVSAAATAPLPWNLAELVRLRLTGLDERTRQVAAVLAVLSGRSEPDFDVLVAVSGHSEADVVESLRRLVAADLVEETSPDVFVFRHALTAECIAGELLSRERRRVHRDALELLTARGDADPAALAVHAAGAGDTDAVVDAARRGAVEYRQRGVCRRALWIAELGLESAPEDLVLLAEAATAAWMSVRLDDAADHAARWLAAARRSERPEDAVAALVSAARIAHDLGDRETSRRRREELCELVAQLGPSEERARAVAAVAQLLMLDHRAVEAVAWADRAAGEAAAVGLDEARLAALVEKGSAMLDIAGMEAQGAELLRCTGDEASAAGHHVLAARAFNNVASLADHSPQRARAFVERMAASARTAGFDLLEGGGDAGSGGAAHHHVVLFASAAEGDAEAVLDALGDDPLGDQSSSRAPTKTILHRVRLLIDLGDVERADAILDELGADRVLGAPGPVDPGRRLVDAALAAAHQDLRAARDHLGAAASELARRSAADPATGHRHAQGIELAVLCAVRAGVEAQELRRLVDAVGEPTASTSRSSRMAALDVARGLVAEAEGSTDEALGWFEAAIGPITVSRGGPLVATAHVASARCRIATGRLEEAAGHLDAATPLLERWRGVRVHQLAAARRRLERATSDDGPALTRREHEVVALVAAGMTNVEIAEKLYISRKTAGVHVSNILAKLGVANRSEVAAWAVRNGLG
ncbi:MAG: LuxR C-terminal-related transcriptional regulator [Actinomycetota bacterium]|nr:LuxR C-terminal-related transcriptional regulator [Actinomycetota bacterium]